MSGPKSPNVTRLGLRREHIALGGGVVISDAAEVYVGIDVSAKVLDVAIRPEGQVRQYTNDPEGIALMMDQMASLKPSRVVLAAASMIDCERSEAREYHVEALGSW